MSVIDIERYSAVHKAQLLRFLSYIWNDMEEDEIKKKFEWRYEKNPNHTNRPFIYLAFSGNKIVGLRAFVVQKFTVNEKSFNVLNPSDAIVHPGYRRMGIFKKLNEAFINDLQNKPAFSLILNLSANKASFSGNIKQGWQKLNYTMKYGYRISISAFFRNFLARQKEKKLNKEFTIKRKNETYNFSQKIHVDKLAELNAKSIEVQKFTNKRDSAFYKWRYGYDKKNYFCIFFYSDEVLRGYLILNKLSDYLFDIEEYHAPKNILKKMIGLSISNLNIMMLRTWISCVNDEKLFRKCGFYIENLKLIKTLGKARNPVLVRPINSHPKDLDFFMESKDLRDCTNWNLFHSDIH